MRPEWVLDEAEQYEIDALIDYSYFKDMADWERSRLQIYSTYQSQSSKRIDFGDFMKFDWEKKNDNAEIEDDITEEEMLAEMRAAEERRKKKVSE